MDRRFLLIVEVLLYGCLNRSYYTLDDIIPSNMRKQEATGLRVYTPTDPVERTAQLFVQALIYVFGSGLIGVGVNQTLWMKKGSEFYNNLADQLNYFSEDLQMVVAESPVMATILTPQLLQAVQEQIDMLLSNPELFYGVVGGIIGGLIAPMGLQLILDMIQKRLDVRRQKEWDEEYRS